MKPSVIEKLNTLRAFVGNDISESDLSTCLRQAGYVVEVAAERILTGQFQPSVVTTNKRPSPKSDKSHHPTTPAQPRKKSKSNTTTSSSSHSSSTSASYETPKSNQPKAVTPTTPPNNGKWLLCQRWISDAICTQRNGRVDYQELLQVEISGALARFRGKNIQGQLPKRLSAFLAPLAQEVHCEARALMADSHLQIGSQIPFSLNVYLPADPTSFFDLFEQVDDLYNTTSKNKGFMGSNNKQKHASSPKAKAAFALLQWAHNGDALEDFDPNAGTSDDEPSSDDELLLEEEEEEQAVVDDDEESKQVQNALQTDNTHCPEMEPPPEFACELRPYQKESLWWMMQRECKQANAEFLQKQLLVLSDLAESCTKKDDEVQQLLPPGISCDCGPVHVVQPPDESSTILAPPIVDNGSPAHLNHPLWERRYLCAQDKSRALSFYVQPVLGVASASPPLAPKPCRGGLLCDAMGLGKTIQMLALIQTSKQNEEGRGATLIVTPLSLLTQWQEEIQEKTTLSSCVYYGDNKGVSFGAVDVVLTTYGTLQGELKSSRKDGGLLLSHEWKRVILDEAHCIKNTATVASRACCLLKAERRWCVSGTIIQNSLEDAYAQLKFLRHEPWQSYGFWNNAISREPDSNVALSRVQKVLAPIMIRRNKDSLDKNGKPILSLPPVETKTITVEFTEAERQFYDALFTKSLSLFEGFVQTGTVSKSWLAIFSLINRLRQTCDHVALTLKKHMGKDEWASRITSSQQVKEDEEPPKDDDGKDIDSRFLINIMDKFKAMQKDGSSASQQSSFALKVAQRLNDAAQGKGELEECPLTLEPIDVESAVVTPCFHVFSQEGLMDVIQTHKKKSKSADFPCPSCTVQVSASKVLSISKHNGEIQLSYLYDHAKPAIAPKTEENTLDARQVLETAIGESMSSKLAAISKELENVWEEDPGSKVLIFSQFLGFLDMMEHEFGNQGITTFRLDGSLSLKDRVKVIQEFGQTKKSTSATNRKGSVLLISMKAGGVGLNLVAASSCFIADPWWNGAVEDQCVNRIHRIGQTADKVRVRKFYVANSVEQRIVQLQEKKKRIANQIMAEGNTGGTDLSAAQPSLDDLKELFQIG